MRVTWPDDKSYVEWRLRELQPVVNDLRYDWLLYTAVALIAGVANVVVIVLAAGPWVALPGGTVFGYFAVASYKTGRRWVEARAHFRYLCVERLLIQRTEAHEAAVAQYEAEAARRRRLEE